LLAFLVLTALGSLAPARAAGDAAQGERIARRWCSSCHVVGPSTEASDKAPAFIALAADPAKTEDYLKAWITNPHPRMPNFNLSRQTVEDLVAYIKSLGEGKKAIKNR
jgi:mono/diheme cytochrome c family protein